MVGFRYSRLRTATMGRHVYSEAYHFASFGHIDSAVYVYYCVRIIVECRGGPALKQRLIETGSSLY